MEDYINELCKKISIKRPEQLGISHVSKKLKLNVYYGKGSLRYGNNIFIVKSTKQKQWQKFAHEVGHYLRHSGNQLNMFYLFRDLQEYEANHFAYHFCVPTFMLEKLKGVTVYEVMGLFNVEYEFASRRLEMYERKVIHERSYC